MYNNVQVLHFFFLYFYWCKKCSDLYRIPNFCHKIFRVSKLFSGDTSRGENNNLFKTLLSKLKKLKIQKFVWLFFGC